MANLIILQLKVNDNKKLDVTAFQSLEQTTTILLTGQLWNRLDITLAESYQFP